MIFFWVFLWQTVMSFWDVIEDEEYPSNQMVRIRGKVSGEFWLDMLEVDEDVNVESIEFKVDGDLFLTISIDDCEVCLVEGRKQIKIDWDKFFYTYLPLNHYNRVEICVRTETHVKVRVYIGRVLNSLGYESCSIRYRDGNVDREIMLIR